MKKKLFIGSAIALSLLAVFAAAFLFVGRTPEFIGENEENEMYDGPAAAMALEVEKTRDLKLGYVPRERMLAAINAAADSKAEVNRQMSAKAKGLASTDGSESPQLINWMERGPTSDAPGPQGNPRGISNPTTGGRIRAVLVDANDPSGHTVFVGSVGGGLWKTNNITATPPTWAPVNDYLSNLAISDIAQDPRAGSTNIMYFGTGEGYFNADAVRGNGIFKSTDGGNTWSYLPSTSAFVYCNRLVVDGAGNVYVATRGSGLRRSTDGGATWTNITPTGLPSDVMELKLSSTGRMHAIFGSFNFGINHYRFTDSPATTTSAAGWTSATTPFTQSPVRTELGVSGDTLYAAPSDGSYQVPTVFKSTDGGANWAATTTQPAAGWAGGQAWYSLAIAINPADATQVILGGYDNYKTITGGAAWAKTSDWLGSGFPYVHADQQKSVWYDNGNKLILAGDGGIYYSTDGGVTFSDKNTGLRIKQFYSVAMRPEAGNNYLLAGAQDNGTHAISAAGLSPSVEVTGGDGAYVAIDQDNPNNMFGAYVFNQYRFSTNGGATWANRNFSSSLGRFINPFELDSAANILYAADASGSFRRWPVNPPTTSSLSTVVAVSGMVGQVSAITVSPYTPNRVLFATSSGNISRVDGADTFASGSAGTVISTGLPAAYISNVAYGTDDNNLIASITNFGQQHVWISSNGGTSWTSINGNLPDMPVRWAMFRPGTNNTAAILGTEAGVWETNLINGATTQWFADPSFPSVRVDMIRYRPSDGLYAAGTHGRGMWTGSFVTTAAQVSVSGRVMSSDGRGLKSAPVTITATDGTTWTTMTGPKGSYQFAEIPAGGTYVVSVTSRRFSFAPRTLTLTDSITGIDFVPEQ